MEEISLLLALGSSGRGGLSLRFAVRLDRCCAIQSGVVADMGRRDDRADGRQISGIVMESPQLTSQLLFRIPRSSGARRQTKCDASLLVDIESRFGNSGGVRAADRIEKLLRLPAVGIE